MMRSSAHDPHPSRSPDDRDEAPHAERRSWRRGRRESVLIGYVLSLSLLLLVANLPLRFDARSVSLRAATTVGIFGDEHLPIISVHEVGRAWRPAHPVAIAGAFADDLPSDELNLEELEAFGDAGLLPVEHRPLPVMKPSAVEISTNANTYAGSTQLRYVYGPPTVDDAPRLRSGSMIIRYPLSALRKAIEGLVIVRFTVEPNGRASGVKVLRPLHPACDAEVVQAVQDARFLPGKSGGRPVPAYSQMTVRFVLAD